MNITFSRTHPWAKQKEIALHFIAMLKAREMADFPTDGYPSSLALAHAVVSIDSERSVQLVEVYQSFVRIKRNEKGLFAFAPVVMDYVKTSVNVSDGCPRP